MPGKVSVICIDEQNKMSLTMLIQLLESYLAVFQDKIDAGLMEDSYANLGNVLRNALAYLQVFEASVGSLESIRNRLELLKTQTEMIQGQILQ